ncbi:long-chain-fatty-acid--CoA ligase [Spiribacter halobius]|uniref:Long-chain-fatty-acid--CoA ligase n=2 Tax=Sediminicurvatus halobius TaxID=2182432 RepID=A0A2U2MWB4_9GAMM|nr:long-chain-fatty-acid--CoA ligase [Spiribacter halobius]
MAGASAPSRAVGGYDEPFRPRAEASLDELVRGTAQRYSRAPAFSVCLDNGLTGTLDFATVDRLADAFAAWLQHDAGIRPGDRVAVQTPNCLGYPVAAFGILRAGAVLVNVNPLYTAPEMRHQLTDAGARVLVIIDLFADKLAEALEGTAVERVVTLGIADLMPPPRRWLVHAVLRHVRRERPPQPAGAAPFRQALRRGARYPLQTVSLTPQDLALLQYTGGTTGVARGAALTHGNLLANLAQVDTVAGPAIRRGEDVVLTALPLYHIFAFTFNLLVFFAAGCHNVLCPSPRPPSKLRRAFERFAVTKFSGVNALFQGLLREPWFRASPPTSIDLSIAGGTALHPQVATEWHSLVGSPICEGYGLSETSPVVTVNPPRGEVRLGTIGLPLPGTEVRLVGDDGTEAAPGRPGELLVRGPQVMQGYWQRPQETAQALEDGWLHTGDIAVLDERGYLRIVDRRKDMIDVSGFNVFPAEVENVLLTHPRVLEAAVVGQPAMEGGEQVVAYIVADGNDLEPDALREWCRHSLTAYKVPRRIQFLPELPKTPVGKVLRRALREKQP